MKEIVLFTCLLIQLSIVAQTTREEPGKAVADAQRQMDSLVKAAQAELTGMASTAVITKPELITLPPRQDALLASIDSRNFTKTQLIAYLHSLDQWLQQKIPATHVRNAKLIAGNNEGLNAKAVGSWYLNIKEEAIYVGLLAAKKDPGDPIVLNNLGALLTLGGAAHKAIPVLKTVLHYYPKNPLALNNMGQAYASLGEADSAITYLQRCLAITVFHPEANHTAGVIAAAKGNTVQAKQYIKNAIKAGARASAAEKMDDRAENLLAVIRRKIRMPDYFNPYKYEFPLQCENVQQVAKSREEHRAFNERMQQLIRKYEILREREEALIEESTDRMRQELMRNPAAFANNPNHFVRPFAEAATRLLVTINLKNIGYETDFGKRIHMLEEGIVARRNQYGEEARRTEGCDQEIAAANRMMRDCAEIRRDIQDKIRKHAAAQWEVWSYYGYLGGFNKHAGMAAFYDATAKYLNTIQDHAKTELESPCEMGNGLPEEAPAADETVKPECPFDIDVDLIVLKIEADCDKLAISGGQGLKLKYVKDFNSGETTLSVGAGLGFKKDLDLFGIAETDGGIELEQSFYIVFDKDNNFSDIGLQFEANLKSTVSSEIEVVTDVVQHTEEIFKQEIGASAGYRLGMNTGFTFSGVLAD